MSSLTSFKLSYTVSHEQQDGPVHRSENSFNNLCLVTQHGQAAFQPPDLASLISCLQIGPGWFPAPRSFPFRFVWISVRTGSGVIHEDDRSLDGRHLACRIEVAEPEFVLVNPSQGGIQVPAWIFRHSVVVIL